jgi:hypothetical protein
MTSRPVEQIKAETVAAEIGRLIAADVHWMVMRLDQPPGPDGNTRALDGGPAGYADTRYTRVLRKLAEHLIVTLETEAGQ